MRLNFDFIFHAMASLPNVDGDLSEECAQACIAQLWRRIETMHAFALFCGSVIGADLLKVPNLPLPHLT